MKTKAPAWRWVLWTALVLATAAGDDADDPAIMGLCVREPTVRVDCYPPVVNFPNATEEACLAQGCCWKLLDNDGVPCAFDALDEPKHAVCAKVANASRVACRNPRFALDDVAYDADTCRSIGCCFDGGECYQPFFEGYELLTLEATERGWRGSLVLRRFKRGPFGNDVPLLQLHVIKESHTRVRVRITDPSFPRYEVEHDQAEIMDADNDSKESKSEYRVHFYERPFGIAVTRRETDEVLFNCTPSTHASTSFNGLVFENQFLELSTHLTHHDAVGSPVLYGLGERWGRARLRADCKGDHYPMFSRQAHEITAHTRDGGDNLGGVHPFYLQMLSSGRAHGVYFRSSNAMEVVTQEDALTFRSTGGVVDFVVFTGPTALDVTSEYTRVVGRSELPPFWALGYHFGKRGHRSLAETVVEVAGLREAGVPLDAYWQDMDYMYQREAFSLDERYFPRHETQAFVEDLHFNNQYYVLLMTPAVPTQPESSGVDHVLVVEDGDALECDSSSSGENAVTLYPAATATGYYPLEHGNAMDVFVKGVQGESYAEKLVGTQWSVFVDFSHPNASLYWYEMLRTFHDQVLPFDGVWVNNDQPSSSCDMAFSGPNHTCDDGSVGSAAGRDDVIALLGGERLDSVVGDGSFVRSSDVAFPFDPYRQPFVPGQSTQARGGHGNLNAATLPMAALHHSSLHYNVHSLYGHQQARTTRHALNGVLGRRSLSLSHSTFSGDGQFAGHLVGDVAPTWENLRYAIASVVQMNLLGVPFAGPSVCGHGIGTTKELSIRWHQAASFFPLIRNHASDAAEPQSPIDFDQETANIVRDTLLQRFAHFPYLYTQMYRANAHGHPVIRALALEFPEDPAVYDVETQYLVGPALMVSPVVDENAISIRVHFPNAAWYDLTSGRMLMNVAAPDEDRNERFVQLLTPLSMLQVHVRGGFIVPTQHASSTMAMTKRGVYRLVVALNPALEDRAAEGELFLDDGDSLHSVEEERYSLLTFKARVADGNTLELTVTRAFHGYDGPEMHVDLEEVVVFGLRGCFFANSSLRLHGASQHDEMKADYFEQADMLVLTQLKVPIGRELELRVEANNLMPKEDEAGGGEEAGRDEHEDEGDKRKEEDEKGHGEAEAHGGKDQHKGEDQGDEKRPSPITGEQRNHRGISTIGIIGIVVAVVFVGGILSVVIRRRRAGYTPIA